MQKSTNHEWSSSVASRGGRHILRLTLTICHFAKEAPAADRVSHIQRHVNFICSWHKAEKQIKTSRWHILDPKRFRQAGNRLNLMRCSLLGIVLCFCAWVQKNVSTHIEDGGMWEEKTLGPHNESRWFCVCQRGS